MLGIAVAPSDLIGFVNAVVLLFEIALDRTHRVLLPPVVGWSLSRQVSCQTSTAHENGHIGGML